MTALQRDARGRLVGDWTTEEDALLRERFLAGDTDAELAALLPQRTKSAVSGRRMRIGLTRRDHPAPSRGPGWQRGRKFSPHWTRERVADALRAYARAHAGELPRGTPAWDEVKRGDLSLPPSERILEFFGALGNAWREVLGERQFRRRVRTQWVRYTAEEDAFIEENVSRLTMPEIADRLGRTEASVTMHARRALGLSWGAQREWWSPQDVADHYGCPLSRVYHLVWDGALPARRTGRVLIDPRNLPGVASDYDERAGTLTAEQRERLEELLRAPNARQARRRAEPEVITRYRPAAERIRGAA